MTKAEPSSTPATLLQLKITLLDTQPPVWRRVLVPEDFSFEQLHRVIQAAMGWEDCHLHEFLVGEERIGPRTPDPFGFGDEAETRPEASVRLRDVLGGHTGKVCEIAGGVESAVREGQGGVGSRRPATQRMPLGTVPPGQVGRVRTAGGMERTGDIQAAFAIE